MSRAAKGAAENILPLYINGLSGRMLRLPPKRKNQREILYVYGHHASLERTQGLTEYFNRYGGVTVPDLPGFGGMQSFYKIGQKPTVDNLADYLAAFVKLRYRNKRFSVAGLSMGFVLITRMLQKYPEIAKNVDIAISVVGFAHKDDFKFKRRNFIFFRWASSLCSRRIPAGFIQHLVLRGPFIRLAYKLVEDKHSKLQDADKKERKKRVDFEVHLWQCNDVRTYMDTAVSMFKLKPPAVHVDLPVYHVGIKKDRYFDNVKVEEHMRAIFKDFHLIETKLPNHAPSVVSNAKEAAPYVPPSLRRILSKKVSN